MRVARAFLAAALVYTTGLNFADPSRGVPVASASTFVELTVAELVTGSASVVCGTPQERVSVWEDSAGGRGRRIVSYTHVHIDRVLDGKPVGEVWVRTLGGEVGDLGQRVDGEAVLVPGQSALMFLSARSDGTSGVVGMGQGHYPLEMPAGQPMRVSSPRALGRLLGKVGTLAASVPASIDLPGRTVEEVAQLVASLRHLHAP
jgi:hypothetical protein